MDGSQRSIHVQWTLLLPLLFFLPARMLAQVAVTGCDQPGCIDCDELGHCTRCTRAIVHGTRQCVTSCPGNYRLVHSDVTGYQGLLCRAHRFLDTADLTTGELAALVTALLVAAVCIGLAIGAFMYLRLRRKMDPLRERLHHREPDPLDLERVQFVTRVRALRPEIGTFLSLLSDPRPPSRYSTEEGTGRSSRHTLRTSQPSSADSRTSQQDLRRLLALLASREQQLRQPPADWQRLLDWAERLLRKHRHARPSSKVSGPSPPHVEYLPRSVTPASRRPRPTSAATGGRPLTSATGSFFSLTQTVIEEEDTDPAGPSSLPLAGARRSRGRPSRAVPLSRVRRTGSRRWRAPGRRRTDSAPGGLSRPAVFVHRVNGGQGSVWGRPGSAPLSAAPTGGAHSTLPSGAGVDTATAPGSGLRPATAEPRPTYRDWPLDRLRHLSQAPAAVRPRPRPRSRRSAAAGSGALTKLSVGSAAPLLWPPRHEDGGLHSDVIEQEGTSFSGRYLHPQDLSTVL
ncbi:uncharacterized protein LOC122392036 [Amphibalanus amphitrite]|uniref:uncharacterized protein LOC122392036 n=1 Tax=Amphibalanus amphitrite TaxID=1232801 RepID=UPI001C9134BC|nr:uncharacterized protein LOC122392036 [Amphibalanus amphitrite]